jgi:hypothetical protein
LTNLSGFGIIIPDRAKYLARIRGGYKMNLTTKQSKLWKLADAEIRKIGGTGKITRTLDPNPKWKIEGTREWALMEATRLASPAMDELMTDEYCDKLFNIINEVK